MSVGVFIGGCWLRMNLRSLSTDGSHPSGPRVGCVPTLLVVWPGASQQWRLQAVGWVHASVPKWQPPGELTLMSIPWGICHQCPCPHGEPQPTPANPRDPPRSAGKSGPGSYGVTALPWFPVHVKSCVHPPRVESLFPPVLWSS